MSKVTQLARTAKGVVAARRFVLLGTLFLAACAGGQGGLGKPAQTETARVEAYLRTAQLKNVPFVQTWPNGATGGGGLTYRPGYLHLVYTAPHGMDLEASGSHAVFKDAQAGSETHMGLSHNPLGLLLGNPIQLSGAVQVTDVQKTPGVLQISMARRDNPSQGLVTLLFQDSGRALTLHDITVVDERRHKVLIQLQAQ